MSVCQSSGELFRGNIGEKFIIEAERSQPCEQLFRDVKHHTTTWTHTKIRWTDRSNLINCSKGDRIPWRHDRTRSTRLIERNNNYDRNVNGTDPDQMSCMLLAVHRQRRKRQVCQISEHTEERVHGTENKGITCHGRCRKISSKKNQIQQNKTCIGRRTDSDHQMCKWSSPVSQISRNRSWSRRKIRRNDSEQSNCVNQTSIVRDDCTW